MKKRAGQLRSAEGRKALGGIFLVAALLFFSFSRQVPLKTFHLEGQAQGTTYHITYYAADSLVAQEDIDRILRSIDSSLSLYKPYSLINRFNASVSGVKMDDHLKKVITKAVEIHKKTAGLFDVTVQPLVEAWGFSAKQVTSLPDSIQIKRLLRCVGTGKLHLKNNDLLYKEQSCLKIDLNGIAQGYSVDLLAGFLRKRRIVHFLVELGGELVVSGRRQPGGEVMTIGIEGPDSSAFGYAPLRKRVRVDHGALTTSGNYRKFYESGSQKINHLIDPFTGYPFQNELISVTVWARDAITADGYDNALMGMGLRKAIDFVKKTDGLEAYFIYKHPDGSIADTATKGFYKMVAE